MASKLNPYLSFKGNAREAMEFYKTVFGGKLSITTFKEFHASDDPSDDDLVMHAVLEADSGVEFMGADTPSRVEFKPGNTMSMSLSGEDEAELRGFWDKLTDGATVTIPLEKAMWGDTFGMLTDKFGVAWMVNITGEKKEKETEEES